MADFRTKLITLAGVATLFAGMAHAQVSSCAATSNAVFVAAEGTTEQVSDVTVTCPATPASATINLSVYLSPSVSITSATLGSGGSAKNESLAGFGVQGGVPTGTVNGSVSGSSVTFNGLVTTANVATTITITNIKINASQIATSSGAPTAVTETIFVGGTNVTPAVLTAVNVAFATNGLTGVKTSQLSGNSIPSIPICTGSAAYAAASNFGGFNVVFGEGFATAFKTQGASGTNTTLGSEFANNTYTGFGFSANSTTNTATSGTRVQIVFNNVPANVTLYAPTSATSNGGTMSMTASATAAFSLVTGSTANGAPGVETSGSNAGNGSYAAVTLSNGSGTVIYEETGNAAGAVETYTLPIYLSAGAASVTAPSSAITATVSFAPVGATSNVPNFVSGSSTATVNGNAFSACTTTLLFPFVTNTLGFDTGIAISNTSTDLLNGGTKSNASPQSGTCALTFFGPGAPTGAVVTGVLGATTTLGPTYAAAASVIAPGFQGYAIANCNFLYAHGFAYVAYNLVQNNGAAMGYLADVINTDRKSAAGTENPTGPTFPEQ